MITHRKFNRNKTYSPIDQLQNKIETLRQKMIQSTYQKGFRDQETLKISRQLDDLIVEYQRKIKDK